MSSVSYKYLILILINICLLSSLLKAQDSSVIAHPPATPSSPAKAKATEHPKVTAPAKVNAENSKTEQATPALRSAPAPAVKAPPKVNADMSIKGQYDDLLKHSWMQQGYKVVNANRLTTLWSTVNDSLSANKKELDKLKQQLAEQSNRLNEANSADSKSPSTRQGVLVSEVSFLGMQVSTSTYNWIVWGLIIILAIALAAVLFTTTKNSLDAKEHKQRYDEIAAEYHNYKTKAKEKELKLARELQTERNTIEELLEKKNEGTK